MEYTTYIELFLQQCIGIKRAKMLAPIIQDNSVIKDNTIYVDKKALNEVLSKELANKIPSKIPYTLEGVKKTAIEESEKEKKRITDKLEGFIKKLIVAKNDEELVEVLCNTNLNDEIKTAILQNIEEKNRLLQESMLFLYKDPLTGLFGNYFYNTFLNTAIINKRKDDVEKFISFLQQLEDLNKTSQRLGIAFVDFANFKKVNDTLNHEEADKILVKFADKISSNDKYFSIRRSGDEFILLGDLEAIKEQKNFFHSIEGVRFLSGEKLLEKGIYTFAGFGIAKLDELPVDTIRNLEDVNILKKHIGSKLLEAEETCYFEKDRLKLKIEKELKKNQKIDQNLHHDWSI